MNSKPIIAPSVLGVVLAGGKSSRMGTDKAALEISPTASFLSHALARFDELGLPGVVSGTCSVHHKRPIVPDFVTDSGPMSGVVACLEYAAQNRFTACLFTPIDVPQLRTEHLRTLLVAYSGDPLLTLSKSNRLEPLIAVYPVSLLESLRQPLRTGRRSLSRWIEETQHQWVRLPTAACHNVNTPEDIT